jgi:histidinol-phosphate aminotransferase
MTDSSPIRMRSALAALKVYRAPEPPVAPDGRSLRLAANEAPYGPLPAAQAAMAAALGQVNRYPDHGCAELTAALAKRYDVEEGAIVAGAGSAGLLQALLTAVCEPGASVVYGWRSFEAYPALVRLAGAEAVAVPLCDERHDLAAMAVAVTERTRAVLICNPNNPTGTVVDPAAVAGFLARVREDCLVVVDEAYHEYAAGAPTPDGIDLHRRYGNVAVLRTFSKAHGLAGQRVGFLVAHPAVADAVRKAQVPFAVNHLAQVAAVASLSATAELAARVEVTNAERERLRLSLVECGLPARPGYGNFIWLRLGAATAGFADACRRAGLAVLHVAGEGVRVTVGDRDANDCLLAVARAFARRR